MLDVEDVLAAHCRLGESPLWHPLEQALYWLDIDAARLHRFDPASGAHQVTALEQTATSLGLCAEGGFIMTTRRGFARVTKESGAFTLLCEPDDDDAAHREADAARQPDDSRRFNDGKTDPQGRFWAGMLGSGYHQSLYCLNPDGTLRRMESGVCIANGLGWHAARRVFYFTDSMARTIWAYDYDPPSGTIRSRRVFARVPDRPGEGLPDGLAVDREGGVWSARWNGWKVVHYSADGDLDQELPMPVQYPTSCAFGGADLHDLYITSGWAGFRGSACADQPQAGDLFRWRAPVGGLPEALFSSASVKLDPETGKT
jgi:sugar lactone lactonase YvrE